MRDVCLRTPRLVVRDLPPSAGARVAAFLRDNWDFHRVWEPHRPHAYFTAPYRRRALRAVQRSPDALQLYMLLAHDGDRHASSVRQSSWRRLPIVGSVSLSAITRGNLQSCVLGYKVDARYVRQGYTREAVTAVLGYVFTVLRLHRVEATIMPSNAASLALAETLGFRVEGVSRRLLQIQGVWEDHLHVALLEDEWQARRSGPGGAEPAPADSALDSRTGVRLSYGSPNQEG